ncbi:MAG: hypothetical protein M1837_001592 [Sclerophora amabilis]|nr:MAG: hypothetical protein M1837_001592 [Sclerophora amabilis]
MIFPRTLALAAAFVALSNVALGEVLGTRQERPPEISSQTPWRGWEPAVVSFDRSPVPINIRPSTEDPKILVQLVLVKAYLQWLSLNLDRGNRTRTISPHRNDFTEVNENSWSTVTYRGVVSSTGQATPTDLRLNLPSNPTYTNTLDESVASMSRIYSDENTVILRTETGDGGRFCLAYSNFEGGEFPFIAQHAETEVFLNQRCDEILRGLA